MVGACTCTRWRSDLNCIVSVRRAGLLVLYHLNRTRKKARLRRAFRAYSTYVVESGWMTGFEPATTGSTDRRSAVELHPPCLQPKYSTKDGLFHPARLDHWFIDVCNNVVVRVKKSLARDRTVTAKHNASNNVCPQSNSVQQRSYNVG